MSGWRPALNRLREWLHPAAVERELDEELRAHVELMTDDLVAQGMAPDAARRHAAMRLGGLDQAKERTRDVRGLAALATAWRDVRYALRWLRRAPGFAAVTIATLTLGIGVNVAIFTLVDAVVLRPLAYPDASRVMAIWEVDTGPRTPGARMTVAPGNLGDYRLADVFSAVAGWAIRARSIGGGEPEAVQAEEVTPEYFETLGVAPALGRAFTADDADAGGSRVALLSHGLWQRRFASDAAVLGRRIILDGQPHVIVGVMPPGFTSPGDLVAAARTAVWVPAVYPPELLANRGDHEIRVLARLLPGITVDQARTRLGAVSEALAEQYPDTNRDVRAALQPLGDDIVRDVRQPLVVLLALVALILTIACVNVANLLLARGVARRREMAVRFALGASRARVVTALVTECLVLATLAAVGGTLLAAWVTNLLIATAPATLPRLADVSLDGRVLAYTALVAVATGLLFGMIPAWQASHSRPIDALAGTGRAVATPAVMRWRATLIVAQLALSAFLLVWAGLMVKSLVRLNSVPLGFDPTNVVAAQMVLPETRYPTPAARLQFFEAVTARLREVPGVRAIGFANALPMRGAWSSGFRIDGLPPPESGFLQAAFQAVSVGYFDALGMSLEDGRLLRDEDADGTEPVAVVSRLFERRYLNGDSAIGRTLRRAPTAPAIRIVGVIADVRREGRASTLEPQVYLPAAQIAIYPVRLAHLAVRVDSAAALPVVPALRTIVEGIDAEQPLSQVRTLDEILYGASADRRFRAVLFAMFAVLAVALASIGTYGVVAFVVSQRTPEIGVRLAMGATTWHIYRWLLTRLVVLVLGGVVLGLIAARGLGRYVEGLLFQVTLNDAASYAGAALMLLAVGVGACIVAGRQATRIDPTTALRYE